MDESIWHGDTWEAAGKMLTSSIFESVDDRLLRAFDLSQKYNSPTINSICWQKVHVLTTFLYFNQTDADWTLIKSLFADHNNEDAYWQEKWFFVKNF